jgi:hypothetical protein
VLDLVTVRAEDDALGDFSENRLAGKTAPDHVRHVEILFLPWGVMELQGTVIGEAAPFAKESLLVIIEPAPEGGTAFIGQHTLAAVTPQPAINLALDDSAYLERFLRLLGSTVFAGGQGSLHTIATERTNPISHSTEWLMGFKRTA